MKITLEWLEENNACVNGVAWFKAQSETDGGMVVRALVVAKKFEWANWTIAHLLNRKNQILYAVFAAGQVLHIFEDKYPGELAPRRAIEAARAVAENDTHKNRNAAMNASVTSWSAASTVRSTSWIAAYPACSASYAARSASATSWSTANTAYLAADAAGDTMLKKIVEHGIELYEEENA